METIELFSGSSWTPITTYTKPKLIPKINYLTPSITTHTKPRLIPKINYLTPSRPLPIN